MREHWRQVYRDAPELFAEFCRWEDEDGRAAERLLALLAPAGRRVLDLGCGTGRLLPALDAAAAQVVGVDCELGLLGVARRAARHLPRCAVVAGELDALPLASATFERAVASHVLAHLPPRSRGAAIADALRVLRPGGELWALEGHWQGEWMELRGRVTDAEGAEAAPLWREHGFTLVGELETRFCFPDLATAERVLSAIIGEPATTWLREHRRPRLQQRLILLRRSR